MKRRRVSTGLSGSCRPPGRSARGYGSKSSPVPGTACAARTIDFPGRAARREYGVGRKPLPISRILYQPRGVHRCRALPARAVDTRTSSSTVVPSRSHRRCSGILASMWRSSRGGRWAWTARPELSTRYHAYGLTPSDRGEGIVIAIDARPVACTSARDEHWSSYQRGTWGASRKVVLQAAIELHLSLDIVAPWASPMSRSTSGLAKRPQFARAGRRRYGTHNGRCRERIPAGEAEELEAPPISPKRCPS
jgi:hypothetical protein